MNAEGGIRNRVARAFHKAEQTADTPANWRGRHRVRSGIALATTALIGAGGLAASMGNGGDGGAGTVTHSIKDVHNAVAPGVSAGLECVVGPVLWDALLGAADVLTYNHTSQGMIDLSQHGVQGCADVVKNTYYGPEQVTKQQITSKTSGELPVELTPVPATEKTGSEAVFKIGSTEVDFDINTDTQSGHNNVSSWRTRGIDSITLKDYKGYYINPVDGGKEGQLVVVDLSSNATIQVGPPVHIKR